MFIWKYGISPDGVVIILPFVKYNNSDCGSTNEQKADKLESPSKERGCLERIPEPANIVQQLRVLHQISVVSTPLSTSSYAAIDVSINTFNIM